MKKISLKIPKKLSFRQQLEVCFPEHRWIWQKDKYNFNFLTKRYLWGKSELSLTAGEQYFLYRYLILGEQSWYVLSGKKDYLKAIRNRYGTAFLSEEFQSVKS